VNQKSEKMRSFQNRLAMLFYFLVAVPSALVVLSALPQHAAPQPSASEIVFGIDPAQSKVHWTLGTTLHTVHGTFAFKNGTLQLDPATGKATGEIAVYATSGDSGNDSRDKKMHKDVLESGQYPDVIFRPDRVEGKIATHGTFAVQVHGILILHGREHELTVPVQAELAGNHWTGSVKFNVPFIDWGLKNPSTFLLKVNHAVELELELKGSLQNTAAH
jgi:polyisoprenoid-binding protein YceI